MSTSTRPPSGTRDFLPDDVRRREHVIGVVRSVYERYGYEPLETPAFENIDTLLGKYGDEGNKLIFKILKRGGHEQSGEADLALRYDLTVPLARVIAQYQNELPRLFKRYQIQPVWRADRPARGRFREFYQCDIDAIGSTSTLVEVDQLAAVSDVLTRLGFADFEIRLNDRRALTALLERAGVQTARHAEALIAIDKLDKIGVDGVRQELRERGVDEAAADNCLAFFGASAASKSFTTGEAGATGASGAAAAIARLRELLADHEAGLAAVASLEDIVRVSGCTPAKGRIRIDPSLARGLSYYTGAIMEVAVPDLAGSLGGGGRYDDLIGMFLGRNVPACGFSLGLERIIVVMSERKMFPASVTGGPVDVLVTVWNEASRGEAVAIASELRASGVRAEVYPETDKIGKQLKHASGRRVSLVVVQGDDERAAGTVAIKDLRTGEQTAVPRAGALEFVTRALAS